MTLLVPSLPLTRTVVSRPVMGQFNAEPAEEISVHHSPDMLNCSVEGGMLVKRPGYLQFGGTLSEAVLGLYSTQDDENNTHLFAVTLTKVYKWNSGTEVWDLLTGTPLTGTSLSSISFETSQNSMVFANGVDKIQVVDFAGTTWATLNANAPIARYITRFANRLYASFTVESGDTKPYRVRRPVASDHTNWTGVGSGFTDLDEFPHFIRGMKKLGTRMVVYTERSIIMAARTEIAAAPARFDIIVGDVGNYSPMTLVGWRDEHFFLGTDDFYRFNGVQPVEMAMPVRDTIFSTLNPGGLLRNFAVARYDTKEYIAFLCTGSNTVPDSVWVYNKQRQVWYPWAVSGAKCGAAHRLDNTITIDELVGTIDEQNWEFDTRDLESQYPAMLTGHSDGKVHLWSTQYKSDNGTAISCRWTSKDFTARDVSPEFANNKVTLKGIAVSYLDQGADFSLIFSYSTDGGATWTSGDTVTFSTAGGTTRVLDKFITRQVTGNKIRFKFEQTSASQGFSIISFHVILEALTTALYS